MSESSKALYETSTHPKDAFVDERGSIKNILERPIRHVAIITSKAGTIRGNHYHSRDEQYIYVVSGSFESYSYDTRFQGIEPKKQIFREGDLIFTPPLVAHAYKYLEDTVFLNLTIDLRESERYEEHTVQVKII